MQVQALILAGIAGVATWWLLELWMRRGESRTLTRVLDQAHQPGSQDPEARPLLEPERRTVVRLSDTEVVCERPDGKVEQVGWAELEKVELVTTGDGPFAPDVFWVLHGTGGGCAIPQGATGEKELLERLQGLPGFDNGAVIEAMGSTSDRRFLCWQRGGNHTS